ncbi:MAG: carbamoyl-phosphate synthase large subunit, partial [bacterium]
MPPRRDLHSILIIGSGPITIGQACEFDYSGSQAVRALKKLGYRVILVNSNPATIMTDPELADATYIEPLTAEMVEKVIAQERPDALLSTMGGQTALNLARELYQNGVLQHYQVELIGARFSTIDLGEDRGKFQALVQSMGLDTPQGRVVSSPEEAEIWAQQIGFPLILRPAYTLGGTGGGIVYNGEELRPMILKALSASPVGEVLVEESLVGYKEFELEVMRDSLDNAVVICSIENFDPLGIHTGDSITVAPAQTLTDKEYQRMRDAAFAIIRAVGVEAGGANIQFGVHPRNGRMVVIEMNPRVSRSSALASKATGFPIAKVAAQLAVGMTLGEITNEITGVSVSAFEPTLDYVVVKVPRWSFEKFSSADPTLGTQMKSVGEVMAIGRTFPEALQKALRAGEMGRWGLGADGFDPLLPQRIEAHLRKDWREMIRRRLRIADPQRLFFIRYALELDLSVEEISALTNIDPWFIGHIKGIVDLERTLVHHPLDPELLWRAKRMGFSDHQIAYLWGVGPQEVEQARRAQNLMPAYRMVDTCAGEFAAQTPYFYSTFGEANEAQPLSEESPDDEPVLTEMENPFLP